MVRLRKSIDSATAISELAFRQYERKADQEIRGQPGRRHGLGDAPMEVAQQQDERHAGQEGTRRCALAREKRHHHHERTDRKKAGRQCGHHGAVSRRSKMTRPVRPTVQSWAAASAGATVTR